MAQCSGFFRSTSGRRTRGSIDPPQDPAIPPAHQEAARAQGLARFQQFVEQLARHLQKVRSLVKDVHEEIFPDESAFFAENQPGRRGVDGREEEAGSARLNGAGLEEGGADGAAAGL